MTVIKACLFDMDGTLVNTEQLYTDATNDLLKQYDRRPISPDFKDEIQGLPGDSVPRRIISHYKLPLDTPEYYSCQTLDWSSTQLCQGAEHTIRELKEMGVPLALCTSSTRELYGKKISPCRDLFDQFDVVVTGDDCRIPSGRGKPAPDIWRLGLRDLNERLHLTLKPHECLVFEDSANGVVSANAFGSRTVWITDDPLVHEKPNKTGHLDLDLVETIPSLTHFKTSNYEFST
ncbi:uncharacterized protein KNAG_0C05640 [Huiozyma naganishii CBS 8797]|uniref:Uncharacterized protein n=1 Tax=Huiozyma naganishii (strain ATCC MYA-139 / BCRC 22969 / CBS 8797 / KCTC 17520 / NBRC 10181 / NCYC 3082 / Yp74L-3) TaxID=1071383 RepID=J7RX78_HUIN7|nr:hypothetical protein KNAG_0C05640 [Kazachstania naganishii CBS 8797]CCK69662.1 hypothetical protein KNAG_0C05640 [Kazachstania naganishii CBS 8797]